MTARIDDKKTKLEDRMMWALWRDFFTSTKTWRMKTPIGALAFRTKKLALAARAEYERRATDCKEGKTYQQPPRPKFTNDGEFKKQLDLVRKILKAAHESLCNSDYEDLLDQVTKDVRDIHVKRYLNKGGHNGY